jgi:hypothetical protein
MLRLCFWQCVSCSATARLHSSAAHVSIFSCACMFACRTTQRVQKSSDSQLGKVSMLTPLGMLSSGSIPELLNIRTWQDCAAQRVWDSCGHGASFGCHHLHGMSRTAPPGSFVSRCAHLDRQQTNLILLCYDWD